MMRYLWKQDEWYYCGIDNNYDFSDSGLWKQVMLWDYEWDKYPTATHYCPVEMRYYAITCTVSVENGLFRRLNLRNEDLVFRDSFIILSHEEIKRLIKRPKEEKKVSNMIGKKSGIDWSGAPEDATHVYTARSIHGFSTFRKNINFHTQQLQVWKDNAWLDWWVGCPEEYISKEEDLGMNKTINDIEVGMFLKDNDGKRHVVLKVCNNSVYSYNYEGQIQSCTNSFAYIRAQKLFVSYSYTYNTDYTLSIKEETEKDKKIKELKETINQAKKQMEELEGLK